MLELLNRARANPPAEGDRLFTYGAPQSVLGDGAEPWTRASTRTILQRSLARAPLAFNGPLLALVRQRGVDMVSLDYYSHLDPRYGNNPALNVLVAQQRPLHPELSDGNSGEDIDRGDASALENHIAFTIDYGNAISIYGGGHYGTRMTPAPLTANDPQPTREYAASLFCGPWQPGRQFEPYRFVESVWIYDYFGQTPAITARYNRAIICGVVYSDSDGDGFYSPGEGVGGVIIRPNAGTYYAVSSKSGAYAIPLEALPATSTVQLTFTGGPMGSRIETRTITLDLSQYYTDPLTGLVQGPAIPNVKVDLVLPAAERPAASILKNLSTRVRVEQGDNLAIAGLVIGGNGPITVGVRGIGPSLANFGITGVLANPAIQVVNASGQILASNDNWQDDATNAAALIAAGLAPTDPKEAALVLTLQPGAYTVLVRDVGGGVGVALAEVYAISGTGKLINVSARGVTRSGNNVLIGGLVIEGQREKRVAVRVLTRSLIGIVGTAQLASRTVVEVRRSADNATMAVFDPDAATGSNGVPAYVGPGRRVAELSAVGLPLDTFHTDGNNDVGGVLLLRPGAYTVLAFVPPGAVEGVILAEIYDKD